MHVLKSCDTPSLGMAKARFGVPRSRRGNKGSMKCRWNERYSRLDYCYPRGKGVSGDDSMGGGKTDLRVPDGHINGIINSIKQSIATGLS